MPDYRMKAESGEFRLTGQDARLIHTIISRVVKKNWWLIGLYATITVGGVLALVTFLIGLRMMHQVTYGLAWRHSSWPPRKAQGSRGPRHVPRFTARGINHRNRVCHRRWHRSDRVKIDP